MSATATLPAAPQHSSSPVIDPKLIVPLMNSIKAVFSTMIKTELTINRPHVKATPGASYDVSGIIGLSGEMVGSIVVSFPKEAASKVVSAFAGIELKADDGEFADAVGELANMIAGGAKKAFGVRANISVPNVIIGPGHQIARLSDVPCIVVPCTTPLGEFAVEINIKTVV